MKQPFKIIACVLLGLATLLIGWSLFFQPALLNRDSKIALAAMHQDILLSASQDEVSSIYKRFKTNRTHIKTDVFRETWEIGMPFELGASDWILYVQFDGNCRVSAVAIRTSDGSHWRPLESPADKGEFREPQITK